MDSVRAVLSSVDEEWRELVEDWMVPQCQSLGYCPEERCCGKFSTKADVLEQARLYREQMAMINSEV
jgi:thymidylate synthase (FAD)